MRARCLIRSLAGTTILAALSLFAQGGEKLPELRPPRGEINASFWEQHSAAIAVAAVAALALIFVCVRWWKRGKSGIPPHPGEFARHSLRELQGRPEDARLIIEVSHVVRNYVIAALGLPLTALLRSAVDSPSTTSELQRAMNALPAVPGDISTAVTGFFRRCDERKFALQTPAAPMNVIPAALALIDLVEAWKQSESAAAAALEATPLLRR